MTRPRYRPAGELSAFALLLRDGWMWKQTPPLNVPDLAARTGIGKMTIWSWINKNARPRRDSLKVLHQVTGIPLDDLLGAAGYGRPVDDAVKIVRRAWRDTFTPDELALIIPDIRVVLERVHGGHSMQLGEPIELAETTGATPEESASHRAETA